MMIVKVYVCLSPDGSFNHVSSFLAGSWGANRRFEPNPKPPPNIATQLDDSRQVNRRYPFDPVNEAMGIFHVVPNT